MLNTNDLRLVQIRNFIDDVHEAETSAEDPDPVAAAERDAVIALCDNFRRKFSWLWGTTLRDVRADEPLH